MSLVIGNIVQRMLFGCVGIVSIFFFKQKTAYEMRISDWSSDVCSSDLPRSDDLDLVPRSSRHYGDGGRQSQAPRDWGLGRPPGDGRDIPSQIWCHCAAALGHDRNQ